ncbi:hypothetical protein BDZ45DRAFT_685762 [Acephala macrosclerotiorum]|nr:hypothetical protein BDZ45DRAFT_685762 [Acephala macrosclerotiorum]
MSLSNMAADRLSGSPEYKILEECEHKIRESIFLGYDTGQTSADGNAAIERSSASHATDILGVVAVIVDRAGNEIFSHASGGESLMEMNLSRLRACFVGFLHQVGHDYCVYGACWVGKVGS